MTTLEKIKSEIRDDAFMASIRFDQAVGDIRRECWRKLERVEWEAWRAFDTTEALDIGGWFKFPRWLRTFPPFPPRQDVAMSEAPHYTVCS